ncbi:UDP-glucose--hexose-1-phosphate uridylyltransferase [Cellulophaga tyrosinoxydans]|uniref:Galactose-1-phosphate uridylyltransferase n=1 Tax=Cellulophaga tyrosinoxydans TaxID=504486 RepID=A0A1W2AMZ4_9FLAO|nr:UDP-glucose--hexose-1-phosphate uridylyltransferase [Cellulophaga tyrosinoxydans]SMC62023.1 UDPglucose--hexose-1-phosphate uridylyltransferase [Cellulophaga tyrosinoxydans]
MDNTFNENPHRRFNILTGEWVLVSPHRTKRPWQGKVEKTVSPLKDTYDENCYLCPTNTRMGGKKNPDYKKAYSFINDFAALMPEVPEGELQHNLLQAKSEKGVCKVVCFSPDHSLTLPVMEEKDIVEVISLWQREYLELGKLPFINHVQIFENKGDTMGCSNPHPHGQIWAQESIPQETLKKTKNQANYWKGFKKSILLEYIEQELKAKERIVVENKDFLALVPFWAIWPYETMIIPKRHIQNIALLNEDEKVSFAAIIKELTIKYDNLFNTSFPYSAGIHQAPTDGEDHPEWHFHMSFYPPLLRSATVKKFMVGYEMFADPQRDITAEQAAKSLRELSTIHYSKL